MVQIISEFALPILSIESQLIFNILCGLIIAVIAGTVIIGGLTRIAKASSWLVPVMGGLYVLTATFILLINLGDVPRVIQIIFTDAFSGTSVAGGTLMGVIMYGIQRGAFSNEAGIGTESLAHGAAKTSEPIREGLVAMLGPIIDTLFICTATALLILVSGVWLTEDAAGVTLTASAFTVLLGPTGTLIILVCVVCFATSTIFTYSFYGSQCTSFVLGANQASKYRYFFITFIVLSSIVSLDAAIGLIDGCFALMAIPTTVSAILLAPKVKQAADLYFASRRTNPT